MKKQLDILAVNPLQWAQKMLQLDTPCDLLFFMSLRDLTDVSYTTVPFFVLLTQKIMSLVI